MAMKQVFFTSSGQILVEEVPAPLVEAGRVLVEVTHSLISTGTELVSSGGGEGLVAKVLKDPMLVTRALRYALQHGVKATYQLATGAGPQDVYSLGYSAAGRVVEVGAGVDRFRLGDRVAIGGYGFASHAEFDCVPTNLTVHVPDQVPLREACFATVGAIALQGVRRAAPTIGETVLVVGLGLLGQLTCQILLAGGVQVIGVDIRSDRVERATRTGVQLSFVPDEKGFAGPVNQFTGGLGADAVILTASGKSSDLVNQAMMACRKKGRVVVVGDVGMDLKRDEFYRKEIDFLISCSYGPGRYDPQYELQGHDYPAAFVRWTENRNLEAFLRLVAAGQIKPVELVTIEEPVNNAVEVYRRLSSDPTTLAAVFRYPAADREAVSTTRDHVVHLTSVPVTAGKIGVALVGAGGYANAFHVPNFQKNPHVQVAGIVSRKGITAKRLADQTGARLAGTDYRALLGEAGVQCVVVATRHNTHVEIACAAAAAGKHVFVEKPIALDVAGLANVVRAVGQGKVQLTVGHNRRFSPHTRVLKQWRNRRPGPVQLVYTVNAGPLPATHWALDPVEGGGRIIGEACHFFDLAAYLVGADPVEIGAVGIEEAGRDPALWQNATFSLRFADGSIARVDYASRGHADYPKEQITLFAGQAVGVINDFKSTTFHGAKEKGLKTVAVEKGQKEQVDDWIEFLLGRPAEAIVGPQAILGTYAAIMAVQSLRTKAPIELDVPGFFAKALAGE